MHFDAIRVMDQAIQNTIYNGCLADLLVPQDEVRKASQALALEIAQSAPLAMIATRETMRRGLVDEVEAATERELVEQDWLRRTEDFSEGIKAMADRRLPNFQGR